jgi:[ribosomal protein S18]-alanine N-acetyltransferase
LQKRSEPKDTNVVVACIAQAVIGVGIMQYGDHEAHLLLLFGIDAPDRRRGLGSQLLGWLGIVAIESSIDAIRLEAGSDNAGAIAFYEKHGFHFECKVLGMYHGADDGIRFVKRLDITHIPR